MVREQKENLQTTPSTVIQRLNEPFVCHALHTRLVVDIALAVIGALIGKRRGVLIPRQG